MLSIILLLLNLCMFVILLLDSWFCFIINNLGVGKLSIFFIIFIVEIMILKLFIFVFVFYNLLLYFFCFVVI